MKSDCSGIGHIPEQMTRKLLPVLLNLQSLKDNNLGFLLPQYKINELG